MVFFVTDEGGFVTSELAHLPLAEEQDFQQNDSKPIYTNQKAPNMQQQQHQPIPNTRPEPEHNVVSWTLSGTYDRKRKVLIDAEKNFRVDKERFVSLGKAIELVASLTGAFDPDSTVCLHLPNHILYPVLCLAIWTSGCRYTGTNTSYKSMELDHHFRTSSTNYVVTNEANLKTVEQAVEKSKTKAEIIIFGDILKESDDKCCRKTKKCGYRCLHEMLRRDRTEEDLWSAVESIDPDSIALLGSTSGTTGRPKMAARTHRAIVHECKAMEDPPSGKPYEVRRLFCTPIFHAFSLPDMVINALRYGIPSYFMERFHPEKFSIMTRKFGITETFGPPAMLLMLTQQARSSRRLQSLRLVYTGGAPFTQELRAKFNEVFVSSKAPPRVAPVWGMTEAGWITTLKWSDSQETNSVGRVGPGYEIGCGEAFSTLDDGQAVHEILVRSKSVMTEYYGNEEATKEAFADGWFKTGDVGFQKDDGLVFLVDRAKDLIKFNGWQVSPTELGDALLMSADVKDAAVVGAGNGTEEHPAAFVVRADESPKVTARQIKCHLLEQLARYKVDKCEVHFLDEIPKNPTGKIDRNELRRLAAVLSPPPSPRKLTLRSRISISISKQ